VPKDGLGQGGPEFDTIYQNVTGAGAQFQFNLKAVDVIIDGSGNPAGMRFVASDDSSKITDIQATNIVFACGSWASNQTLVQKYIPNWLTIGCLLEGSDGDAIKFAESLGGTVSGVENYLNMNAHSEAAFVAQMFGPSISVLQNGKRFYDETAEHTAATSCVALGMGNWWSIWDDQIQNGPNAKEVASAGDARVTGNTVAELADAMSIPEDALQATFDEYNTMCDTQSDPSFGRTLYLKKLNPPYYAFNNRPVRYKTLGGVLVDAQEHVLKADNSVIPGLYACGIIGVSDYSADIVPAFSSGMYCGDMIVADANGGASS
jgi:fumarate reductase flavoprotein subunit